MKVEAGMEGGKVLSLSTVKEQLWMPSTGCRPSKTE